jgi:hypothetical protein
MKHYAKIFAVAAVVAFSTAAHAENSLKAGSLALNVTAFDGTSDNSIYSAALQVSDLYIIQGKYFLQNDLALLGGVGIGINGGDANGTDFGIRAGARKYLKTADFAPFVGGFLGYSATHDSDIKITKIIGEFGAEYFFSKQFSVEGAARAGYVSYEAPNAALGLPGTGSYKGTYVGTASAGFSINYYF